jgi:hypothetical protein
MALGDSGGPMCETRFAHTGIAAAMNDIAVATCRQGYLFPPCGGNLSRSRRLHCRSLHWPAEFSAVDPHPVQDDGKFAGDCDTGLTEAFAFCDAHAPGFESRPSGNSRQQHIRRFKQIASEHAVAALGDAACPVRFTRRVSPCGQSHIGSNTARFLERCRIIDGGEVTECRDRATPGTDQEGFACPSFD